jgi:hypothetical protein
MPLLNILNPKEKLGETMRVVAQNTKSISQINNLCKSTTLQ